MAVTGGVIASLMGIAGVDVQSPAIAREGPDRAWIATATRKPSRSEHTMDISPSAPAARFANLDAYLAYLRDHAAPIDRPWYREVRPGVYALETGNLRAGVPPRLFTREELERKFGFRH